MEKSFHIITCVFEPNMGFLQIQLQSLLDQTHKAWTCEIRVDYATTGQIAQIQDLISADQRFKITINESRLGVFHNFEAGLIALPSGSAYIAYCDQDDVWLPTKLTEFAQIFESSPKVILIHSDLRVIDSDGHILHNSCVKAEERDVSVFSLAQLIVRNSITGCALAVRSSIAIDLLPFPYQGIDPKYHHDLWTALIATQCGEIYYLNRQLVLYRQHGKNVIGAEPANLRRMKTLMSQVRGWREDWRLREQMITEVLSFMPKGADRNATKQRDEIRKWTTNRISFGLARMAFPNRNPSSRVAAGMMIGKLLVSEKVFFSKLYRFLQGLQNKQRAIRRLIKLIASFLADRSFRAKATNALEKFQKVNTGGETLNVEAITANAGLIHWREKYSSALDLKFTSVRPRLVIVLPNGAVDQIYGGLATAFRMGGALAEHGIHIRFLLTDQRLDNEQVSRLFEFLRERCGLSRVDLVEIESCYLGAASAHRGDLFFATIWWSARRISKTIASRDFEQREFYYLIQDFEPGFYPWSDEYALAEETYRSNCRPIVNTTFLASHLFKTVGLSTPASRIIGPEIGKGLFAPPLQNDLDKRRKRRIVFYGRPSTPRNLFKLGVTVLHSFVSELNLRSDELEIVSAGESHPDIHLANDVVLRSLGKLSMTEYAALLKDSDLGLSLMLSPHPSYPPFEMAKSGMIVVTNNFLTKEMQFGNNIIATSSDFDDLMSAIRCAWTMLPNSKARIIGSNVDLSSLGKPLVDVVLDIVEELIALLVDPPIVHHIDQLMKSNEIGLDYIISAIGDVSDFSGRKVCLFSHFDIDDIIDRYVLDYLNALKQSGYSIVFISSNLKLKSECIASVSELCTVVMMRENKGMDFAGWSLALRLFPSILSSEEVLCTNDSIYGPIFDLGQMFCVMNQRACDFWAVTDSYEVNWHLQSYFLVFKRSAVQSAAFAKFWQSVIALDKKSDVIKQYELKFAQQMENDGLVSSSYVSAKKVSANVVNPTHIPWRTTLTQERSPFVKIELLRDNPLSSDISGWEGLLSSLGFDVQKINNHLVRVRSSNKLSRQRIGTGSGSHHA